MDASILQEELSIIVGLEKAVLDPDMDSGLAACFGIALNAMWGQDLTSSTAVLAWADARAEEEEGARRALRYDRWTEHLLTTINESSSEEETDSDEEDDESEED